MARTKAFNEEEVLEKATELFWKKGYSATSIQDLVDHLGINRASIYDTFGGKDALFEKAFDSYKDGSAEGLRILLNSETNAKGAFEKLFKKAIAQNLKDKDRKGCFVVNTITEMLPGESQTKKKLNTHRKLIESIFVERLQAGVDQKQISKGKDLTALASTLFTFYNGLQVVGKLGSSKAELERMTETVLGILD